nr:hypothetical protein [uncultured Mediterraneibacter sp.]
MSITPLIGMEDARFVLILKSILNIYCLSLFSITAFYQKISYLSVHLPLIL